MYVSTGHDIRGFRPVTPPRSETFVREGYAYFQILQFKFGGIKHRSRCRLSVRLSVTFCVVAKRYILQQVSEQVNRKCPLTNTI